MIVMIKSRASRAATCVIKFTKHIASVIYTASAQAMGDVIIAAIKMKRFIFALIKHPITTIKRAVNSSMLELRLGLAGV